MRGGRGRRVRRIAVVTGTRAEYGLLKSTMQAIAADPRLKLQVVVTGMHLLRKFGHTVDEIVRDGWRIDARVAMQSGSDAPLDQATGLARGVAGLARFFRAARTDIVVVLGDRIEALAGALAAVTTGRLVAHI
ncbi:MAG TPA: UDP-N-acetylglucosamine 2-epimerase, partial [Phycisphaerae bacterium]|nr:UDP-N-acetylglucosamine 2-epimerase [Phycisphaerae bacterium]